MRLNAWVAVIFAKQSCKKKSINNNEQLLMQSELTYVTLSVQETEFI